MNLTVKPSQIPNAGMGLYTDDIIEAETLITEYTGEVTSWAEAKGDWHNVYIYFISDDMVIDANNNPEVYARYANDASGLTNIKKLVNNCEFVNIENRIYLKSLRRILPNEEILVSYGEDYWDTIRKNSR